jgi:hypothetical protein
VDVTTDEQIRDRIARRGDQADRRRLKELKVTLDQCWDLLGRRRALKEFDLDADASRVRPREVVERYDQ